MSNNMDRNIPKKYKRLYNKAVTGRSRKAAIRSFCLECTGYSPKETENCTDKACPLYKYRLIG